MLKKIIEIANTMDQVRFFPRLMMAMYLWMLFSMTNWFILLPDPSNNQSAFVSVVMASFIPLFTAYVNSSKKKDDK